MSAESGHNRLTVYSRHDCHLCEMMIAALQEMQGRFHFEVQVVDVDGDPELARRYGERVPVLTHGERELCQHLLDRAAVMGFLGKMP
ncbi:MAG: glutaredoxin family protein [Burkholderiales bacterium]